MGGDPNQTFAFISGFVTQRCGDPEFMNQLSIEKHILDYANMPTDNEIDTLPRRLVNMMRHVPAINFC